MSNETKQATNDGLVRRTAEGGARLTVTGDRRIRHPKENEKGNDRG